MHILLVGRGRMATAVEEACLARGIEVKKIKNASDNPLEKGEKTVAIHFGSGRQFPELLSLCEKNNIPIIQGSTDLRLPHQANIKAAILEVPNLSFPVIRFLSAFPAFANTVRQDMQLKIVESHQQSKRDVSGTARALAKVLGFPESNIVSIRDPDTQLALGVPMEHLDGHAYHDFIFVNRGVEIKVSIKITGRATYVEGVLVLALALSRQEAAMKPGIYGLKDILSILKLQLG